MGLGQSMKGLCHICFTSNVELTLCKVTRQKNARKILNLIKYNDTSKSSPQIANELAEANRLKRLELKLRYNIPEFDLESWGLVDKA